MKYSNIKYFSTINGAGVRTAVFVSGCDMNPHCKGCFNQIAWDFNHGSDFTEEVIDKVLESIEPSYCRGLSILGGEPLADKNLEGVSYLIQRFREKYGNSKDVWLWSGYYVKDMTEEKLKVAKMCDYIVDGHFDSDLYSENLRFKGSSNQTVWNIKNGEFIVSEYN
jgi:anaerobic ribonucleoside-triphosphate reductase activating protein